MKAEAQKTIGGRAFQFGVLPADKAYRVFMIVVRNLGAPLAGMAGKKSARKEDVLGMVTSAFFTALNDAEIKEAMEILYSVVACLDQEGTGKVSLATTFQGRLLDAFNVAIEAFKVNFSDFLAVASSLSASESETKESSPSSPLTSIGLSGSPAE